MREQGLRHVVGLGMIQNSVGRGKEMAESKKEEKRRRAKRKRNLKHTLLHLVRPFCVENQQPERFFAFRVVENMCKSLDIPAIEALAKQDWQTQLFDNFEKAVAEVTFDFKKKQIVQPCKFHQRIFVFRENFRSRYAKIRHRVFKIQKSQKVQTYCNSIFGDLAIIIKIIFARKN